MFFIFYFVGNESTNSSTVNYFESFKSLYNFCIVSVSLSRSDITDWEGLLSDTVNVECSLLKLSEFTVKF